MSNAYTPILVGVVKKFSKGYYTKHNGKLVINDSFHAYTIFQNSQKVGNNNNNNGQ